MRTHRLRGVLVVAVAAIVAALVSACTTPTIPGSGADINYIGASYLDTTTGQWVGHYDNCGSDSDVTVQSRYVTHAVISDADTGTVFAEGDTPGDIVRAYVGGACFAVNLVGPEAFSFNVSVNFLVHA